MISNYPKSNLPNFKKMDSNISYDSSLKDKNTNDENKIKNIKKKTIPIELTAYGTTPSGKPRLFVCQACTRAFARLEHLRRHERSHTKEKPFSCGVCQRKFSRRDLLLRHAQKLHAGCADAITRLRRKSIKRNDDDDDDDILMTDSSISKSPNTIVEFNLNLFKNDKNSNQINQNQNSNPISRRNSALQRQIFQNKRKSDLMNLPREKRGTSFSAQSGSNYAMAQDYNDYPHTENVEFSTPQLNPTSMNDEISWLNNLSTIPGMLSDKPFFDKRNSISDVRLNSNSSFNSSQRHSHINDVSNHGSFSGPPDLQYMLPTVTMGNHDFNKNIKDNNKDKVDYGYSFYDIPENLTSGKIFDSVPKNNINNHNHSIDGMQNITVKQEHEENIFENDPLNTNHQNFDLNFLNDMEHLTHEFDVNSKFMSNGYSFYGDTHSVSSAGIDSPHIFSTQPLHNNFNQNLRSHDNSIGLHQQDLLHLENIIKKNNYDFQNNASYMGNDLNTISKDNSEHPKNKLYTANMRQLINKALEKYPISGISTPSIPSNEKLEFYLTTFIEVFLTHFPFIHESKLNEEDIMKMTSNESPDNETARVCLPLLIATIGALLANHKNDSENLYEASRRTIHIYLESRKNSMNNDEKHEKSTVNPLWLIQSLTLSVIYGLFSDNENNVYIVIRQLNALNSLVKTSIKSSRLILFSINGEDEKIFKQMNSNGSNLNGSLFNNNTYDKELKFRNYVNIQSQTRIVFMIYRINNFLLMMYNVPLTLSINDLQNVAIPNEEDEFLWNFKNYQAFLEYCQFNHLDQQLTLDVKLSGRIIIFKDLLFDLIKLNESPQLVDHKEINSRVITLSKIGFVYLLHGIYEISQYEEMSLFDVFGIIDYISRFITFNKKDFPPQSILTKKIPGNFIKIDFVMLANYVKINSIINFKLVKEQSWLRNFNELNKNYSSTLDEYNPNNPGNRLDDSSYLKIVDCCLMILKLILFKSEDSESGPNHESELLNLQFSKQEYSDSNCLEYFEKHINLSLFEELDSSNNSIHSQMLFHVFTILSIFSIYMIRKNSNYDYSHPGDKSIELNERYNSVIELLSKIERFLKVKYSADSNKIENELNNLYLFNGNNNTISDGLLGDIGGSNESNMNFSLGNGRNYSLDKTLYILKVGECVLNYLHDTNVKISIYKKLSTSLLHIRNFLIDNENHLLN